MTNLDEKSTTSKSDPKRVSSRKSSGKTQPRNEEKEQIKSFQGKKWEDWKKESTSLSQSPKTTSDTKRVISSLNKIH